MSALLVLLSISPFLFLFLFLFLSFRFVTADGDFTLTSKKHAKREEIEDKVVWVTGASRGIGKILAKQLASLGAKLILSARNEAELEQVKKQLVGKHAPDEVKILPFDLASGEDSLKEVVEKAESLFPGAGVDYMIHNAAFERPKSSALDVTEETLKATFNVNVLGTISLTRLLVPFMLKRGRGHLVVMSSAAGKNPAPGQAVYSASKYALNGYFHSVRSELFSKGIKVTVVCPGPIATSNDSDKEASGTKGSLEKRVSSERCAELTIIAATHGLNYCKNPWIQSRKMEILLLNNTSSGSRALHVQNSCLALAKEAMSRKAAIAMEGGKSKKTSTPLSLEQFVSITAPLLDLEKEAEIAASISTGASRNLETAQKRGSTILNLKCVDAQTGLMGKTLLELQSTKGDVLPAHKFGTHDVVVLKPNKADLGSPALGQGVVYRLKDSSITVAFDDIPEDGLNSPLRLEKVANEVTFRRMKDALIQLSKGFQKGPAADLIPVLFGERPPTVTKKDVTFNPFNSNLDQSQRDAISKALSSKNVFLLHGPPGTGKTTTVVEIILQEVKRGAKILACAASNIAVDNIVERLVPHRVKLVRLGHPARLLPQVLESALDAQVLQGDNSALASDIRKEMKALNGKLLKTKDKNTRRDIQKELRTLSKEERKRQQLAVTDVIKRADVVLTTLTGAFSHKLDTTSFDLVIIDEAAQALEIACWIALLKGSRCILAGDHLQLPPTIQSVEAERKGLGRTLFERLADMYGDEVMSMLTVQYRMHELIMNWSSKELYSSKIKAHPSVAAHMLFDLEDVKRTTSTEPTLLLIDIAGCDMEEKKDEEDSTLNEGEAEVAMAHAKRLVGSGVQASDIGIITPYAAQVVLLKILRSKDDKLKNVEISTVDGFQGREKEAIVISMVRSNSKKEVGFLSDRRRMNVAVTRARRQCCLVCDTETVNSDAFLKRLIEYFEEHGEYVSGSEYQNE